MNERRNELVGHQCDGVACAARYTVPPERSEGQLLAGSLTTAYLTSPEVQSRALLARVATAAQVAHLAVSQWVTQYPILATSYSI